MTCHVTFYLNYHLIPILQGAQFLAEGLTINKTLLWLGLGQNALGPEGAWALADALQNNSALLWLGIGANELGDRGAMNIAGLLQSKYYCFSGRLSN